MRVDKLIEGQTFKNYRHLCEELEIEAKRGNSKKAQVKEIERYCLMKKDGHKIIIEEVFETPFPELRGRGGKTIYGDLLQLLITDHLLSSWSETGNPSVLMTRNNILQEVKMINQNYSLCSVNVGHLSTLTNINTNVIYDFFNSTSSTFKYSVESSLDRLRDLSLIFYDRILMVSLQDSIHRPANDEEKEIILASERNTLNELGYSRISQVRVSKNWGKFKKSVMKKISESEHGGIRYYYMSYKITINTKHIEENHNIMLMCLLDNVKREGSKNELNKIICERLLENASKRSENTSPDSKLYNIRRSFMYTNDNKKLIDILIDSESKSISSAINKIREDSKM